jgi:hypothetical protein
MRSLLLPVVLSVVVGASATAPTVSIGDGTLQGGQCNGSSNAVYFKGIPYAQPPTGDLRFAAPKAYAGPYPKKPLVATSSAPTCIQFGTLFTGPAPFSEDWYGSRPICIPIFNCLISRLVCTWTSGRPRRPLKDPICPSKSGCTAVLKTPVVSQTHCMMAAM